MTRNDVFEQLTEVFQDVFDDDTLILQDTTTADDIEDWDSLTHISLMAAVEDSFDIRFDMKQVIALKNVGELVDAIMQATEE